VDNIQDDVGVVDVFAVSIKIEADEAGCFRDDRRNSIVEARLDGIEHNSLDEFLLRVEQEVPRLCGNKEGMSILFIHEKGKRKEFVCVIPMHFLRS
jgi:hypothetical protein